MSRLLAALVASSMLASAACAQPVTPSTITPVWFPHGALPACSRTYATGVVNAGLQAVQDLDGAFVNCNTPAGHPVTTKTAGVTANPAGMNCNSGTHVCTISANGSYNAWNFTGYEVDVECVCNAITLDNDQFANNGGFYVLELGLNNAQASVVTVSHSDIDETGGQNSRASMVVNAAGTKLVLGPYTYLHNAPVDDAVGEGELDCTYSFLDGPGLNGGTNHIEPAHWFGGAPGVGTVSTVDHCLISGGTSAISNQSAGIFVEGLTGPDEVDVTNTVIENMSAQGFPAAIETNVNLTTEPYMVTMTISNVAADKGTSVYFSQNGSTCPTNTPHCNTITEGTNYDYTSGVVKMPPN